MLWDVQVVTIEWLGLIGTEQVQAKVESKKAGGEVGALWSRVFWGFG